MLRVKRLALIYLKLVSIGVLWFFFFLVGFSVVGGSGTGWGSKPLMGLFDFFFIQMTCWIGSEIVCVCMLEFRNVMVIFELSSPLANMGSGSFVGCNPTCNYPLIADWNRRSKVLYIWWNSEMWWLSAYMSCLTWLWDQCSSLNVTQHSYLPLDCSFKTKYLKFSMYVKTQKCEHYWVLAYTEHVFDCQIRNIMAFL